ncbi:MAG: type III-B CRISPR-associated protein Cas10/Cmr2 [Cyanothece sp. SIO1E1]|nr:type III-B CRISPR-associated protein Cas10/Cmr2 [Cyanothece sp. SIO1E1]
MTDAPSLTENDYARKLYAFLRSADLQHDDINQFGLHCLDSHLSGLENWWCADLGQQAEEIAASSDRTNLHASVKTSAEIPIRHPISGERRSINPITVQNAIPPEIQKSGDIQEVFWWFWRFYPEWSQQSDALLFPAHRFIPDCPLHSYQATVSALAGVMWPQGRLLTQPPERPYLLLFTFSPVQEFIKASRKFLDFWAGSYLLHYLSVKLCWYIAQQYGPDAIIVPSLWGQEIIDALLIQKYENFRDYLKRISKDNQDPVTRFNQGKSTSLSTAGFPNVITVLVPGKAAAEQLGKDLKTQLKAEWQHIGNTVRNDIRQQVSQTAESILVDERELSTLRQELNLLTSTETEEDPFEPYRRDLERWSPQQRTDQQGQETILYPGWEWNKLWDFQLENTWEPYWAALPLGNPEETLKISREPTETFNPAWKAAQTLLAQAWETLPSAAEADAYQTLNVGTWWGSLQQRLRQCVRVVKNTRTWAIPAAPGERSTISGQFSAVHPSLNYTKFAEGAGLSAGSMRFFGWLMARAYPGLFSGSERLNALELTKRMAWDIGGIADELGIEIADQEQITDEDAQVLDIEPYKLDDPYERLIRFPNLSSIASARFVHDAIAQEANSLTAIQTSLPRRYWNFLARAIKAEFGAESGKEKRRRFASRTRCRPFHIAKVDQQINSNQQPGRNYNGVMFSSKWLAEDMGLEGDEIHQIRETVQSVHKHSSINFGDGSPSDWWAIVLADGDGMGEYISGNNLEKYQEYIIPDLVDRQDLNAHDFQELLNTKKRMGPATHIALNRALLDFSNRLVPYLTEKRFCGKVIYSGGDDVMVVLPLEDLPKYLLSLRAAWCGDQDPDGEFANEGGYWTPRRDQEGIPVQDLEGIPNRPHFTMGQKATMSAGVVIAYKTVPLPTVLENLWAAEKDRAKAIPGKDGLCFRVIYGGGNTLEALMKGDLLSDWWRCIENFRDYQDDLSPVLYRLAEELPRRASLTHNLQLFSKAAGVIMRGREEEKQLPNFELIQNWLDKWEEWAWQTCQTAAKDKIPPGTQPEDLGKLLRFTAFWVDKRVERFKWLEGGND